MMTTLREEFFASVNVNIDILEPLHSGTVIFNHRAELMFVNATYKKMYYLDDTCIGLDAMEFFLTTKQGILEVLKIGEANSCASVSINGSYDVTYRWPLRDREGRAAGCMMENISVSPMKGKIHEMQNTTDELENYNSFPTTLYPRQNTEIINSDPIAGESPSTRLFREKGKRLAQNNEPILTLGENGTGKDLIAQAIHVASLRHARSLVTVNYAAIPYEFTGSELFGYEAGAFTGVKTSGKQGQFESADGGTIFLDKIGEMPLTLQAKPLRVLENHEIKKLGAVSPRYVDFHLVSATNRDLEQMVQQGWLCEDLYYRLNLLDLVASLLRKHIVDISLLVYSIPSGPLGPEHGNSIRIAKEVFSLRSTHPWRGNVRELRNILTYALYSMKEYESELCLQHLLECFFHKVDNEFLSNTLMDEEAQRQKFVPPSVPPEKLSESRLEAERRSTLEVLKKCGGSKVKATKLLGIARSCLYKKISILDIKDYAVFNNN